MPHCHTHIESWVHLRIITDRTGHQLRSVENIHSFLPCSLSFKGWKLEPKFYLIFLCTFINKCNKVTFRVKINLCRVPTGFQMKSLKSPRVHCFPYESRPLKPITVLFLQLDFPWVSNCSSSFITFKALAYLDSEDRILLLSCSGWEVMEKETIELPSGFHERSCCTPIILKALLLCPHSCMWLLHCVLCISLVFVPKSH